MVVYRPFHNADPPRLRALWHRCELGRGAAEGFGCDALEIVLFSQPYFDRENLIVAEADDELVGYVHVGFGANPEGTALDHEVGIVCAIMVDPAHRRSGIGRELLQKGVERLKAAGATTILAGPEPGTDPFYTGLYGGARLSGFLESDPAAGPFLAANGFEARATHLVYGRDLDDSRDPVNFRLVTVRRKMQLAIGPERRDPAWWWLTRFGRLDTVQFLLAPKSGGDAVAGVTVVGLDLYQHKWQGRSIGMMDLFVPEDERRNGYAQALVLETCRRLREELVSKVEVHVAEENTVGARLLAACAFEPIDRGIVYRLAER